MIRLIALDLDQTLFGTDMVVSPRVRGTIQRAQAAGAIITIATGRDYKLASRFARELNVTAPIITSQGGTIYDVVHDRILHDVRLPAESLPRIMEAAARHAWTILFEVQDLYFLPEHLNHPPLIYELLRYSKWAKVGDILKDLPELPTKFVVTLEKIEDRNRVVEEIHAELDDLLTAVPSHPHLVEGLPKGVHKGHGLSWLAQHLGIDQSEVMAIGDSEADIPMIKWAGAGIAMGNASEPAKAAADWVAPSLREDGAAVAIERFVLNAAS